MRGTTSNWQAGGTAEIAKLTRTPYFDVSVDWAGTELWKQATGGTTGTSSIKVSNLGSAQVAQFYGTDNAVVGSAQSAAVNGTVTIDLTGTDPELGYLRLFSDASQGTELSRFPHTYGSSGTFTDGDLYMFGSSDRQYNAVTDEVTGLSWRQEYEDDYVGQVPAGARSGDCDIELATGSKYSYFNSSSPLYNVSRLNKEATVDAGFTSGTSQYLRAFTGPTASLDVKAGERSTSLQCTDRSEALRAKNISLPLMTDVRSDNLIRAILAECGIACLPDIKQQESFFCKFNNSITSEQGDVGADTLVGTTTYDEGKWNDAVGAAGGFFGLLYSRQFINFSRGSIAFWTRRGSDGLSSAILLDDGGYAEVLTCTLDWEGNTVGVAFTTGGSSTAALSAAYTLSANIWYHICFTWDDDDGTSELYIDGSLVDSSDTTGLPVGTAIRLNITQLSTTGYWDNFWINPNHLNANEVKAAFLAGPDDANNIDPGKNTIDYAYLDNVNAWEAIKEICEAEGASAYFDAEGKFHFENRYHLLGVGHNTSVKTISYDADVEDLSLSEDAEGVINYATVRANPLEAKDGADIWSAQDNVTIPRNGSVVFFADLQNPAVGVDTSFTGTRGTGQSRFQACRYRKIGDTDYWFDQTGSVGLFGTVQGKSVRILGTNKMTTKDLILCGTDGNPYCYVYGSEVAPSEGVNGSSKIYAEAMDTDSMSTYGTRSLDIENAYIDSFAYAQSMAQYAVMMRRNPQPRLEGLVIMADPRLELGDRVAVEDSSAATGIDHEFWVTGMDSSLDDMYKQNLAVEYAPLSTVFILDHATQGRLDYNVLAF